MAALGQEFSVLRASGFYGDLLTQLKSVISNLPVSSSDVERSFSLAGTYLHKLTSMLSDQSLENITFGSHDLKGLNSSSIPELREGIRIQKE